MPKAFVHLHNHSCFSLLDGAAKIPDIVKAAVAMDMPAVAITDHGVMYGVVQFYKACKDAGIKPIIGCEVYVTVDGRSRFDRDPQRDAEQHHLVLLAENAQGYKNLIKLVSAAFLEGFYYKPRVDRELLARYHEGLIALSACLGGEVPYWVLRDDSLRRAREAAAFYRDTFGPANFYIELQDHGIEDQARANPLLVKLAKDLGIPLVCSNDSHYLTRDDAETHDVMLCIQTNSSIDDPNRMRYHGSEFYLKSGDEMWERFGHVPDALHNTLEIAERCNLELELGRTYLPHFDVPEGYTVDSYLRHQCEQAIPRLYPNAGPEVYQRLDYELKVISEKGFSAYFLIVQDFANFAKSRGILAGARGSAAGSLVSYLLGLTRIDPIKHGLMFERFLVPERITPPDIDMDFEDTRRDEVLEYVRQKYGEDRVAQIITFGTMAARAAVRDAGRALGVPLNKVDHVAKLIPFGSDIDSAIESISELRELNERDPQVAKLLQTAKGIVGMPRHSSTHAAGVVIAAEPLTEHVPLQRMGENGVVTQFDFHDVSAIGLLKMDFLGLSYLSVVSRALKLIEQTTGQKIDLDSIPYDDEKTYRLLQKGDTAGVFQLESSGMRALLRDLKPSEFEDVIAVAALYRPGPLQNGDTQEYVRRKHGLSPVTYFDDSVKHILEPILKRTYGLLVYQEQAMKIAQEMAGFRAVQADDLRTAISKKKVKEIERLRVDFINGAVERGVKKEVASAVFDAIESFGSYAFNLSHSAAYAVLAYQTAYLKANYRAPYMAAKMTAEMDNKDKLALYVEENRQEGIQTLPPDINRSEADFTVDGNNIRFGLAAIKGVGRGAIEAILEARKDGEFTSLFDFCRRVDITTVNRASVEALIQAGAFDSLCPNRASVLAALDTAIAIAQRAARERSSGQTSLFALDGADHLDQDPELPNVPEMDLRKKLALEKDLLGLYLSDHPLRHVQDRLAPYEPTPIAELSEVADRQDVTIAGIVTSVRRAVSKSSGREWMQIVLEDLTGSVNVSLFPKVFEEYGKVVEREKIMVVYGKASHRARVLSDEEESYTVEVAADRLVPLDEGESVPSDRKLHIRLPARSISAAEAVKQVLEQHPGALPLVVHWNNALIISKMRVAYAPGLAERIESIIGPGNVWVD
ncbi:MAG: DNA polymerase III subunit alpha [Armatimonadota bacterium]